MATNYYSGMVGDSDRVQIIETRSPYTEEQIADRGLKEITAKQAEKLYGKLGAHSDAEELAELHGTEQGHDHD